MKTSNIQTSHNQAIIKGWVNGSMLTADSGDGGSGNVGQYENDSGGDFEAGDVVALADDGTIVLAAVANDPRPTGVVLDDISDTDFGPVVWQGPVDLIKVTASVTAGDFAETTTTPGEASGNALPSPTSFGYFTSSGTTPSGFLTRGGAGGSGAGLPWFNVTDYGALGDGSTDDRASINSAISALIAAGAGVLYFPASPDAYVVSAALTTLSVPCTVMGDGMYGVSVVTCTSQTAVLFTTSAWAQFRDLNLTNTYAGTASAGAAIVSTNSLLNEYESLLIQDFYTGLDIEDNLVIKIRACHITDVHKYGVRLRNTAAPDAGDWFISDSWFGTTHAADAGIQIESGGGGKITNCKINGDTGTDNFDYGINLAIPTSVDTSILLVANTSIENVSVNGINGTTAAATSKYGLIQIDNCEFLILGNTGKAISLVGTTAGDFHDITITACTFTTPGTARSAMTLTNCTNIINTALMLVGFNSLYTLTTTTIVKNTGSEFDYSQFTSNVNITATTEATANSVVAGASVTYDGITTAVIEFYAAALYVPAGAARTLSLWLYDGSSSIGKIGEVYNPTGDDAIEVPCFVARRLAPSAAAHQYSIRGSVSGAFTGIVAAGAGGAGNAMPGYIRIIQA